MVMTMTLLMIVLQEIDYSSDENEQTLTMKQKGRQNTLEQEPGDMQQPTD